MRPSQFSASEEMIDFLMDLTKLVRAAGGSGTAAGGGGGAGGAAASLQALSHVVNTATRSVELFVRQMQRSIERAQRFTDFRLGAGGGTGATAQSSALLSAIGVGPNGQGALVSGIRDAIAQGGVARGAASQLGVGQVLPHGFGGPSDVDILLKLAEGIRSVTSEQEAYNLAIKLGAPELLRFRLLGDQQIKNIRALGEEMKRTFSPEAQARLARFQADFELASIQFQLQLFRLIDNFLLKPIYGNNPLSDALGNLQSAMNGNTSALNQNTVAINQGRNIFGGGERARGAFPAGLRGELLRKQMQGDAIKLGAFAL